MRVMWSPLSAAGFISCFLLLLIASVADGRAAISLQKPLRPVVHRPGQFNLTVFKTGFSASPVTIIVEVCYASHVETELLSINPFVLYVLLVVSTIITGRIAAKRQTAGNKFTQRPKITIFAPQGLLVAPIQVKFGTAREHAGPLGRAKFRLNQCTGSVRGLQNRKFLLFGRVAIQGQTLWPISTDVMGFYELSYPDLVFYI